MEYRVTGHKRGLKEADGNERDARGKVVGTHIHTPSYLTHVAYSGFPTFVLNYILLLNILWHPVQFHSDVLFRRSVASSFPLTPIGWTSRSLLSPSLPCI